MREALTDAVAQPQLSALDIRTYGSRIVLRNVGGLDLEHDAQLPPLRPLAPSSPLAQERFVHRSLEGWQLQG
eukprot:1633512-Prymnesium_polylepis.1